MPGIIKAHDGKQDSTTHSHIAFNFEDIGVKAENYLEHVKQEAAEVIACATRKAEQVETEVYQKAKQQAQSEFDAAVEEKTQQRFGLAMPAIEQAIDQSLSAFDQWRESWEQSVIQLAIGIAEKIINRQLDDHPGITLEQIRSAVMLTSPGQQLELKLNPYDVEILGDSVNQLLQQLGRIAETKITPDASVDRGGCLIVTEFGLIDNQIRSQLERIETELSNNQKK